MTDRVLYQPTGTEHLSSLPGRTFCGRRIQPDIWIRWDEQRKVSWVAGSVCQVCQRYAAAFMPQEAQP